MPEALRPDRCGVIVLSTFDNDERVLLLSPAGASVPDELVTYMVSVVKPIGMPLLYEVRQESGGKYSGVSRFRLDAPDYSQPKALS